MCEGQVASWLAFEEARCGVREVENRSRGGHSAASNGSIGANELLHHFSDARLNTLAGHCEPLQATASQENEKANELAKERMPLVEGGAMHI